MADFNGPFILQSTGAGPQRQVMPDGTAVDATDDVTQAVIITPGNAPTLITQAGTAPSLVVAVLSPYSLTVPPGVMRVG